MRWLVTDHERQVIYERTIQFEHGRFEGMTAEPSARTPRSHRLVAVAEELSGLNRRRS